MKTGMLWDLPCTLTIDRDFDKIHAAAVTCAASGYEDVAIPVKFGDNWQTVWIKISDVICPENGVVSETN